MLGGKYSAEALDVHCGDNVGAAGYLFPVCEMAVPDCRKGFDQWLAAGLEAW